MLLHARHEQLSVRKGGWGAGRPNAPLHRKYHMPVIAHIETFRREYQSKLLQRVLYRKEGRGGVATASTADTSSQSSTDIAAAWLDNLTGNAGRTVIPEQTAGREFVTVTAEFIRDAFDCLVGLRPGEWSVSEGDVISSYDQYYHLNEVQNILRVQPELRSTFGMDYLFRPKIVITRAPIRPIDFGGMPAGSKSARLTPLLEGAQYGGLPILHASVSCKLTMRSDRAQNARTEAVNLIRNRKGHTPHIASVTAEPLPGRITSLALGTGDLDCVYHAALPELTDAVNAVGSEDAREMLNTLVEGRRLRDISDLPFDLAI